MVFFWLACLFLVTSMSWDLVLKFFIREVDVWITSWTHRGNQLIKSPQYVTNTYICFITTYPNSGTARVPIERSDGLVYALAEKSELVIKVGSDFMVLYSHRTGLLFSMTSVLVMKSPQHGWWRCRDILQ
jgi:hypothetical protein